VVIGIGVDVVDIERFGRALDRTPALKRRLFGEDDLREVGDGRAAVFSLAARFAAKEAALKALGGHISNFSWTDVQVLGAPGQPPTLSVRGGARARSEQMGVARWHLSLSHDGPVAVAFVIATGGAVGG
jgi:holo-[acyl-carrier protein] synthase